MFFVGVALAAFALGVCGYSLWLNKRTNATAARVIEYGTEVQTAAEQVRDIATDVLDMIRDGTTPEELTEKIGELRRATAGLN